MAGEMIQDTVASQQQPARAAGGLTFGTRSPKRALPPNKEVEMQGRAAGKVLQQWLYKEKGAVQSIGSPDVTVKRASC